MMIIAALAIWFILVISAVALCRMAASADDGDVALFERRQASSATEFHTTAAGLVVWEEQPGGVLHDLRT